MEDDHKNDWKQRSYKYPLKVSLQAVIDQWKNDRVESWTKPGVPEDIQNIIDDLEEAFDSDRPFTKEEIFEMVEELAEAVKGASQKFVKSEALQKFCGQINCFYENTDLFRCAEEHLEVYLAKDAVEKSRDAAYRLMSLEFELYTTENLNLTKAVVDFLQLVVRCYIWGFDAECTILCRSAIEKAIEVKVSDKMCEKRHLKPTLDCKIKVAKREGLINDEIYKIANSIKKRGNITVHEGPKDPNVTKLVRQTIKETVRVISVVTDDESR